MKIGVISKTYQSTIGHRSCRLHRSDGFDCILITKYRHYALYGKVYGLNDFYIPISSSFFSFRISVELRNVRFDFSSILNRMEYI